MKKYISRLKEKYFKEVVPLLQKEMQVKSSMRVPRLVKICVNQGVGRSVEDKKRIEDSINQLSSICGQHAVPVKAQKSISNFKLREGLPIGVKVTLRNMMMYDFLERLIVFALPRIRDFSGVSRNGFDGHGNYNLGIKEQIIFPEISIDKVPHIVGLNISFVTNTESDAEAYKLLKIMGIPFND